MNIKQVRYILSVAESRHFERAAAKCFITQSTLSTMIGRFEDEIGIRIFDRKTKPITITREGEVIISKLQQILNEVDSLDNLVQELKGEICGDISIGIIPTIAPFLLPRFISVFASKFPSVRIIIKEMTTEQILNELLHRELDIGIAAIPLKNNLLEEIKLYHEPFVLYNALPDKSVPETISINQIDYSHFWLLEEGHCMRTQVEKICELSSKRRKQDRNYEFKAGSIDSLVRFTKTNKGMTILPYLSTLDFDKKERKRISYFTSPKPLRTVGLIVHQHFVKKQLLNELKRVISDIINPLLDDDARGNVISPL